MLVIVVGFNLDCVGSGLQSWSIWQKSKI